MSFADFFTGRHKLSVAMLFTAAAALAIGGCMPAPPTAVSPAEIPELEARLADDPNNADLRMRYAAALYTADRCDTATVVASWVMMARPHEALGPLVVGQCLEGQGRWDQALVAYRRFLRDHPDRPGAGAIRARERIALRGQAVERARIALREEEELGVADADASILAVLPLVISGDSVYQPLSRGLAQIITSDLGLLQAFRMVERLRVNALVDEMRLAERGTVDVSTAARMGRLLQAGRMVQGLAAIPPEGDVRLEATVVLPGGEVLSPAVVTGRLRDLMRMEKDIVVGIAGQLGYQLSAAELQLILENGTQNLAAFLAYSRGLAAEDAGDFSAAAVHFSESVREDPGFTQAAEEFQAAVVAEEVQQTAPADIVAVATTQTVEQPPVVTADVVADAVTSTVMDVAATQTEQVVAVSDQQQQESAGTATGDGGQTENPPPPILPGTPTITGTIRIYFRLP